ncbi:hypothetical protein JD844_019635 [Phrynosoma platyrhinos]|uniref:Uncharacterized protein n=1 Tax=Phrynosoma platyrhinos TaxID=52577 RepID=A0ABQ7TSS2_PHRPL|nr:hypothetical protein JD844_019635 [Phrynosoma platyrhinos]
MALEGGLYSCGDPAYWRAVWDLYQDVLDAKGIKQRKLIALDKWYQEELPIAVGQREEKYLTQEELVKLMEWKLCRGKFRPRLQQLVATNSREMVEACTKKAYQLLPDIPAAVQELSKLKAVGPATASAILAAGAPEAAAFMADEVMESIPGLSPVQYTLKHYLLYLDRIQSCATKLNKADTEKKWTPHCVERCLWAWAIADKLQLPSLQTLGLQKASMGSDGDVDRPRKKQKTE